MATEGMTAVLMTAQGPAAKVLHIVNDAPKPKRGPGEVLVRLVGTSVNPVDVKIRSGELPEPTVYPKVWYMSHSKYHVSFDGPLLLKNLQLLRSQLVTATARS